MSYQRKYFVYPIIIAVFGFTAAHAETKVQGLDEDNWRSILKHEWMIEFFAPWCPACKNLAPTWDEFATWSDDLGINVGKIDVTTSPALSGRFFVTALPTIFHVIEGEFRQYKGSRDLNALMSFIEEKKWKSIEPISMWKKPDSIQMSIVSYFFKLSNYLKEINNRLLQDYGLPVWGSYGLFALTTIIIGALLGLLLVCIIDCVYPPKNMHRHSFSETRRKIQEENTVEDIVGDELEDESEGESRETSDAEKSSASESDNFEEETISLTKNRVQNQTKDSDKESSLSRQKVGPRKIRKAD